MVLKRIRELLQRGSKRPQSAQPETDDPATVEDAHPFPPVHRGPEVVHHPVALQDLDPDAVRIIKRLTRFDHTAYLVGGCVRDLLLERKPKDFDIGTSATPRQIKRLFSNCRIIGRRFRLAHIYFQNGKIIEVATFRARDGDNGPADDAAATGESEDLLIRDDNVFGTPEEDALRRDFTINALFYDVNAETVIDHADGMGDLRRRLVRTIGDPAVRFREDPIRILRAIKFAARLDFAIEPETLRALEGSRSEIPKAAPPRVLEEINRFCRGGAARRSFDLALETGVFGVILPELAPAFAAGGSPRRALDAMLDRLDARWSAGHEVATAEIFLALFLPVLAPKLGWALGDDAPAARVSGDARTIVDGELKPFALRLRIARKDQERVRQALATLHRMVPVRAMRRGTRSALMRRAAFSDAYAILEALGGKLGGAWAEARASWEQHVATHAAATPESAELAPADTAEDEKKRGRRRGRRGGRGRRRTGTAEGAETEADRAASPPSRPAAAEQRGDRARDPKLPPVWDDDYFFAALPSVPEIEAEERDTGRYGGGVVPASQASAVAAERGQGAPQRKRRRRGGRRHRKERPIFPSDGSPAGADGEAK
jgi:poly(A) polymerase